jgi:hypothetical protein
MKRLRFLKLEAMKRLRLLKLEAMNCLRFLKLEAMKRLTLHRLASSLLTKYKFMQKSQLNSLRLLDTYV